MFVTEIQVQGELFNLMLRTDRTTKTQLPSVHYKFKIDFHWLLLCKTQSDELFIN